MPQWSDRKVVHAYILAAIGLAYGRFEQELGYPAVNWHEVTFRFPVGRDSLKKRYTLGFGE